MLGLVVLLAGAFPIWQAWRANRTRSLLHAVYWAILAWAAWCAFLFAALRSSAGLESKAYLALCLTGCAGVAVLGARRPGATAWNFVVVGLLAVNLLPLIESLMRGGNLDLDAFRATCVAGTVAVGILNYLPTRLAPAAILLLVGGTLAFSAIVTEGAEVRLLIGSFLVSCVPWVAYVSFLSRKPAGSEFDYTWFDFRDRYGFVWAQRVRDQFNRSAAHSAWPVILRWQGLRLKPGAEMPDEKVQQEIVSTLKALLKRFSNNVREVN